MLLTSARTGIQSACSSATLNQIPRKPFTVHSFNDAGKLNTHKFQFLFLEGQKCVFIEILCISNKFYSYENNIYSVKEMQHA
jgi:hypothetical protein